MAREASRELAGADPRPGKAVWRLGQIAWIVLAAHAPAVDALGLLDCYRAALSHDSQIASAEAVHRGGVEVLPQAQAQLGTTVQLSGAAGVLRNQPTRDASVSGRVAQGGLQVSHPLIHIADFIAKDEARHQVTRTDAQFSGAKQDLFMRVAQAYFAVLLAQDNLDLTSREKESIFEQMAEAKRTYEVGTSTVTDLNDARVRYEVAATTEIQNRGDVEVAGRALEIVTGIPTSGLEYATEDALPRQQQLGELENWTRAAEQRNPGVLQAVETADIQHLEIERSRSVIYPNVDVVASYTRSWFSESTLNPSNVDRSAEIGIQVTMPLWDGGMRNSRIRQALAGSDQAQDDLMTARRAAAQSARQAYIGVSSASAQYGELQQAAAAAQSSFVGTQAAKEAGYRTAVDVLNARQILFEILRQAAVARYAAILSLLQLKEITGDISETDLSALTSPKAAPPISPDLGKLAPRTGGESH